MPKLIAANFKMNGSFSFIEEWFDAFNKEDTSSNEVIVALPAPYLGLDKELAEQLLLHWRMYLLY